MVIQRDSRGQTTIDFALGAAILLLGVAFVILMAPNLFTPFETGQSADPLTSDRVADHLVAEFDDAGSVDAFFADEDSPVNDAVGVSERQSLNVSIEAQGSGETLHRGPSVPSESGQVTQSQRLIEYDEEPHWLVVEVW